MKLLVLGAGGQLGQNLCHLAATTFDVVALDRNGLDITNAQAVLEKMREITPDLVINAAAYTAVDKAESEPDLAFKVNQNGPENIAKACLALDVPLIHISTDYVFDGDKKTAYTETDPVNPMGVYGQSKNAGEEAVRAILPQHIILRISWAFGLYGHNFVKTIQRLAREREELKIVSDQHGCPTSTVNVSKVLLRICHAMQSKEQNKDFTAFGTYHYCDLPQSTWYEFANAIIENTRQHETLMVKRVLPIATNEFPLPAKRPQNSRLDCSKLKAVFDIDQYSWQDELKIMIKELVK